MPNKIALTKFEKADLFDRLIKKKVLRWRFGPRAVRGQMVEKNYIEHGPTKSLVVDEE